MTSTTAGRTLPILPTVSEAFASVLANWQALLRMSWAWLAILIGLVALELRMFPRAGEMPSAGLFLIAILFMVLGPIAFASTAVAWHRLLLLGEQPPAINLRVGGPALRYLGRLLLVCLAAAPIQVICVLLFVFLFPPGTALPLPSPNAPPSVGYQLAFILVALIVSLPAGLVIARISISLPSVAIERPMGLEDAWQLTVGNSLQLCGGTLLLYVPVYAVGLATQLIVEPRASNVWTIFIQLGVGLFYAVSTVAAISFLSLGYRFFAAPHPSAQMQSG